MSDAMDQKHEWMRIHQKILNCINANKIDLIRWFVAKDESLFQCYNPTSNKKQKRHTVLPPRKKVLCMTPVGKLILKICIQNM